MFKSIIRVFLFFVCIIALFTGIFFISVNKIDKYLSKTSSVDGNVLIVEGWLYRDALKLAYTEYVQNNYEFIVTTGLKKSPDDTSAAAPNKKQHHKYSVADDARRILIKIGVDSTKIIAVPCEYTTINRTLTSAKAFREWLSLVRREAQPPSKLSVQAPPELGLSTTNLTIKGINVVSAGAHARRSHFTYSKLLGKSYPVGIISLPVEERENRNLYILYQALDLVYYWFILIPY